MLANTHICSFLRQIMLTTLKMVMNVKTNVNGFAMQLPLHTTRGVKMTMMFGIHAHLFLVANLITYANALTKVYLFKSLHFRRRLH